MESVSSKDSTVRCVPLCAALLLCCYIPTASALGLGKARVLSAFGEPLKATIAVIDPPPASQPLKVRQLRGALANKLGYFLAANTLRLQLKVQDSDAGQIILLESLQPLRESFVSVLIEVTGPSGKIYRDYDLLLDFQTSPLTSTAPEPQVSAAQPGFWTVRIGDTLSEIAQSIRPDPDIKLTAVISALMRRNPKVFAEENMHHLQSNMQLALPNTADFAAMPRWSAEQERPASPVPIAKAMSPTPVKPVQTPPSPIPHKPLQTRTLEADSGDVTGTPIETASPVKLATARPQLPPAELDPITKVTSAKPRDQASEIFWPLLMAVTILTAAIVGFISFRKFRATRHRQIAQIYRSREKFATPPVKPQTARQRKKTAAGASKRIEERRTSSVTNKVNLLEVV